jgi:hypothetical protein
MDRLNRRDAGVYPPALLLLAVPLFVWGEWLLSELSELSPGEKARRELARLRMIHDRRVQRSHDAVLRAAC